MLLYHRYHFYCSELPGPVPTLRLGGTPLSIHIITLHYGLVTLPAGMKHMIKQPHVSRMNFSSVYKKQVNVLLLKTSQAAADEMAFRYEMIGVMGEVPPHGIGWSFIFPG